MPQHANRFWVAALVVAWAVDFLFFSQAPGVSFLIWMVLALGAGLFLARSEGVKPAPLTWVLLALLVVLGAIPLLRAEPLSVASAVFLSLGGLLLLGATFRNGHWFFYRTWDTVVQVLGTLVASIFRPFDLFKAQPAAAESVEPRRGFWKNSAPVLRGILIAVPVVTVLAALLSSADLVFADRLKALLTFFDIEKLPQYVFRLIYILILTFLFTGVYLHALQAGKGRRPAGCQSAGGQTLPGLDGSGHCSGRGGAAVRFLCDLAVPVPVRRAG